MSTLRCKCGKKTGLFYMSTQDCQGCEECGTTYAGHPDHHKPLIPHDWGTMYNQKTGKPFKRCIRCGEIDDETFKKSKIVD